MRTSVTAFATIITLAWGRVSQHLRQLLVHTLRNKDKVKHRDCRPFPIVKQFSMDESFFKLCIRGAIPAPKARKGHFCGCLLQCSLNRLHIVHRHVYTRVRAIARTYVRLHARTRTRSIANSTRKRTQTQINARKRIAAIDAWAISACKRDCVLRVGSKTFRMYYILRGVTMM